MTLLADARRIHRFSRCIEDCLQLFSDGLHRAAPGCIERLRARYFPLEAALNRLREARLSRKWAAPLVESELVPRAARLLQLAVHWCGAQGLSATASGVYNGDDYPLLHLLQLAAVSSRALQLAAEVTQKCVRSTPYDRLSEAVLRLVEQLSALPTLQALAGALRLMASGARAAGAAAEHAATAGESSASQLLAALPAACSSGGQPPPAVDSGAALAAASPPAPAPPPPPRPSFARLYCELLSAAAGCLAQSCIGVQDSSGGMDAFAMTRRQLTGCKASGVLEALCAAALAAPPAPDPPGGAAWPDEAPLLFAAQLHLYDYFYDLAEVQRLILPGPASALLAAPEVARLRWAGLEQVAALGAREAGVGAGPPCPRRWPLLHRRLLEHESAARFRGKLSMGLVFSRILGAGVCPTAKASPTRLAPPPLPTPSGAAAATAPGSGPSPQRLAALAAPIARAMCAEVEALSLSPAEEAAPSSGDVDRLLDALRELVWATSAVLDGVPEAELHAALPDALEVFGWVLGAPWGASTADSAGPDECTPLLERLAQLVKDRIPPAVLAACARRLLPTGLFRTLDSLLRQELEATGGVIKGMIISSCAFLVSSLLAPTIGARLETCRAGVPLPLRPKAQRRGAAGAARAGGGGGDGGGGGPLWHPQDELGLMVTWAKVARTMGQPPPAAVLAVPGQRRLECMSYVCAGFCTTIDQCHPGLPLNTIITDVPPPLPPPPLSPPADGAAAEPAPPGADSAQRVRVAVLEAVALYCRTSLQLLVTLCDSAAAYLASAEFAAERPSAMGRLDKWLMVAATTLVTTTLASAPGELLAAEPQRVLAAVVRLMVGVAAALAASPGGEEDACAAVSAQMRTAAGYVARAVTYMACDEQLMSAVAGWLQGGPELDVGALAAVVGAWDPGANALLTTLRQAAASGHPLVLQAAARVVGPVDVMEYGAWGPLRAAAAAGGLGGAPLWPPRVLRLCGNPGCSNLGGGEVEADLKLQQCSGCRVLRYCCAGCQGEHWRQGHKAECAAVAAGRSVGCRAGADSGLAAHLEACTWLRMASGSAVPAEAGVHAGTSADSAAPVEAKVHAAALTDPPAPVGAAAHVGGPAGSAAFLAAAAEGLCARVRGVLADPFVVAFLWFVWGLLAMYVLWAWWDGRLEVEVDWGVCDVAARDVAP